MNNDKSQNTVTEDAGSFVRETRTNKQLHVVAEPHLVSGGVPDAVVEVIEPPLEVPKPSTISKEDQLELQVFQLEMQNVQLQLQVMQADMQKALTHRNEIMEKVKKKRVEMQEKYGVDITKVNIDDKGKITPIPNAPSIPGI